MIRKIYNLIPKKLQQKIKLLFYNSKEKDFSFSLENDQYRSKGENWSVLTTSPLYFIVKDLKRYERFYNISPGDTILDAGANEGILTVIYSQKVQETGKIFSFEPDSNNIENLKMNLALNNNHFNIQLIEKGIWNRKMEVEFFQTGNVASSIFYEGKNAVKKKIQVISIDEFVKVQKIQRLDFIKMDIEGAEIEAIRGAKNTIENLKPNFAIASYHIVNEEYTYKALESIFLEFNYPYKTVFYGDGEIITYAGSV